MDQVVSTFSSLSCDGDTTTTDAEACPCSDANNNHNHNNNDNFATSDQEYKSEVRMASKRPPSISTSPLISSPDSMDSCNSSVGSTPGRRSHQVARSLAVSRRKRIHSTSSISSTESLNLPSLNESRNDQELVRFPFDSETSNFAQSVFKVKTDCSEDGAEWETSLRPGTKYCEERPETNDGNEEEKKADSSPAEKKSGAMSNPLSPDTLDQMTEQIIIEAKMETMKWRKQNDVSPASSIDSEKRREIVREALENAASKNRDAASASSSEAGAGTMSTASTPRMRSTSEVLSFVSRRMTDSPKSGRRPTGSDHASAKALPSPCSAGPVARPQPTPDGRPPLSPMTPTGAMTTDPYFRFQPSPTAVPMSNNASKCLSPAESSMGSLEDYEKAINRLPIQFTTQQESDELSREKVLRRIDGIDASPPMIQTHPASPVSSIGSAATSLQLVEEENSTASTSAHGRPGYQEDTNMVSSELAPRKVKKVKTVVIKSTERKKDVEESSFSSWFNFLWGGKSYSHGGDNDDEVQEYEESLAPMSCGRQRLSLHEELPTVPTSLVRVASRDTTDGYAEAINAQELFIDPRMPEWIDNQFTAREGLPKNGTYQLAESRTVIVHELIRGSWTWCTAWSPDGRRLAIGTENHHLAVVDTYSSSVWRIKHDKRVTGLARGSDATHSIRSIAWGTHFIAIGGVGSSVSILAPTEPYPILHKITPTGFVGSLHWLRNSNTLLIGSRNGKALIVKIWAQEPDHSGPTMDPEREISSTILHTVDRERAWVNVAKFSPGGKALAVGDSKGILGVYSYEENPGEPIHISNIANFKLEDSILDMEWSPDGQWLYAGGEDFVVTVINTQWWEAVHRIKRDRWVQFIASSHGGSHVAIGGVSSEVSIMDVDRGWDTAINVSLKGLVPLSARWHPQDQYLVVTGQNNSVLAVETTNSRYVSGHFLRSVSPILAIEFSPDGRMAAIGNEAGVVTIFKLSGTTFITTYELVLDGDGSLSIEWSRNGGYLAVVAGSKVVIIAKSSSLPGSAPPNASGFHVASVVRDFGLVQDVTISPKSRFVAISGFNKTRFLDATANFKCVFEVEKEGTTLSNSWSPDGCWFATIGKNQNLIIYETKSPKSSDWKIVFTVQMEQTGLALAWGPAMLGGLQYCAYGGEDKKIYIMEIRTKERTWETVLGIPREGAIHDLDWNAEGLVAAAISNGTVTVMDLSYLQSGWAVNEMDYNWQRQALTCFTEIRRNKGKNVMKCVRWIPSAPGSDSLLAVGGTDGEVEIVDLTDRHRCSGFSKVVPSA